MFSTRNLTAQDSFVNSKYNCCNYLTSAVWGSSKASLSESYTLGPVVTSVSMGRKVTLGVAKQANTSCREMKGVSVGETTDWPLHWPHM